MNDRNLKKEYVIDNTLNNTFRKKTIYISVFIIWITIILFAYIIYIDNYRYSPHTEILKQTPPSNEDNYWDTIEHDKLITIRILDKNFR